jgi:hypothetical protein
MADEPLDDALQDPPEDRYDPSELEVTRGREQGLGVGARDLARQRDPHRLPEAADEIDDEE